MTDDADDATRTGPGVTCAAVPVDVEGKQAVWIFTEFETGESLKTLRDWLIPDHWPSWGGEMFKEMRPLGSLDLRSSRNGAKQTHSDYLEVVEIGGHRLETELRCDFKSVERWAATSYDLNRSIGDMLQVDRGYLMVSDVGGRRHVKALKVVGFTNTLLNTVATDVCPEWSTWVQRATTVSAVRSAGGANPTPGSIGDSDPRLSWSTEGAAAFTGGVSEQFIETVTDMMDFYGPFVTDVSERVWSGRYGQTDLANDTSRLFQRLARDWSRAWQTGMDGMSNWADVTVRPTAGADPGRNAHTIEHTTLMVKARSDDARVSITDLTRVGDKAATVPSSAFTLTPSVIEKAGPAYVTVQAETSKFPAGLYEGSLVAGTGGKQAPALFYVSHAQLAGD
jgi:hypothetical protein